MNVELSDYEREMLAELADEALAQTRVEVRRTRNPLWREELQSKDQALRTLTDRLRASQGSHVA